MLPQNNGSKEFHVPNSSEHLHSLEVSDTPTSILQFMERFTQSQMEFVLSVIHGCHFSRNSTEDAHSWLIAKAKEYDNRVKPLNPRLEFRSNTELLEFIITCALAEANKKPFY
jgi:hypothetical protein